MKRVSASRNTQLPIYGLPLVTAAESIGKNPSLSRYHHLVFQPLAT
jgi:hypothetical protein